MVQVLDLGGKNPWARGVEGFFEGYTPRAMERLTQYERNRQMSDILSQLPENASLMDVQRMGARGDIHPDVMNQLLGATEKHQVYSQKQRELKQREAGTKAAGNIFSQLPKNATLQDVQAAVLAAQEANVPQEIIKAHMDLYEPSLKQQAKTQGSEQFLSSILPGYGQQGQMPQQRQDTALGRVMQPQEPGEPQGQPQQQQTPQQQPFDIKQVPEQSLLALSSSPDPAHRDFANAELKRRENVQKQFNEDRKFHAKGAEKTEERVAGLREAVPKKKMALNLARDAVQSGEVGSFSLANLAERSGVKEFQTAKGAQLVTAGKENLLGNMSRVSAKGQNQWFEQRLNSMFPQIGQSKEANETIDAMLQGELKMDENYLRAYNELAKKDEQEFGYKRNDLDRRAREMTEKSDSEIMKETSFKLREIYEREKGIGWMQEHAMKKVPQGTPLTPQMYKILGKKYKGDPAQTIENAKRLGYEIPTASQAEQWL